MPLGCRPADCLGFCDKSLMAICVLGHEGRISAVRRLGTGFKMRSCAVAKYASKELEVNSGAFVDDFLNAIAVILRGSVRVWKGVPDLSIRGGRAGRC